MAVSNKKDVAAIEREHEERYRKLLENIEKDKVFSLSEAITK